MTRHTTPREPSCASRSRSLGTLPPSGNSPSSSSRVSLSQLPHALQKAKLLTPRAHRFTVSNDRSIIAPMATSVPNSRDTEAKLDHILCHSARIFAEKGFEGASIRDISRATGISLSGLYYYFDSKQKLLYLIQNNTFTFILARLQSRLPSALHPAARLRILVANHIEYFLSHPSEMKVLSHEEDALDEPLHAEVAAIKRKYYALA